MAGITTEGLVRKQLDDLPVIIDGPGRYRTRDNRLVVIHQVGTFGTFKAKGTIYTPRHGKKDSERFGIWHVSGRAYPLNEVSFDIVKKDGE